MKTIHIDRLDEKIQALNIAVNDYRIKLSTLGETKGYLKSVGAKKKLIEEVDSEIHEAKVFFNLLLELLTDLETQRFY